MKKVTTLLVMLFLGLGTVGVKYLLGLQVKFVSPYLAEREVKKEYISNTMHFNVRVPSNSEVTEILGSMEININGELIEINRNGTNFESLEAYLYNLNYNTLSKLQGQSKLHVNNKYETLRGFLGERLFYFIKAGDAIYSLSTNSPDLYDELDVIAQSFIYIED